MFIVGKIIGAFLMPPGLLVLLSAFALAFLVLGKRRIAGIGLVAILVVGWALSSDPVAFALIRPLETAYPPLGTPPSKVMAVVVLGGGYVEDSPEYGNSTIPSPETLQRALYGAEIAKRAGLPLVWTSGNPAHPESEAGDALGVQRLWVSIGVDPSKIRLETRSKDTSGNARFTAALVGKGPVLLVTSAWHMPRSMLAFRHAGIEAVAAPTAYHWRSRPMTFFDLLPSAEALRISSDAIHEYLGLAWYSLARK